jgi:elongation factor P
MATISYSEIKKGVQIILNNQPYEVIEAASMFKGRGHSVLQAKLKNLIDGSIVQKTIHPSDDFLEAEISKIKAKFIYSHRNNFFFSEADNPQKRFDLNEKQIGPAAKFLKPNQIVEGIIFKGDIVNVSLPIKIQLKVKEAPPGVKGDRAQGGNKIVVLETGAEIAVPLFVQEGDIVEINTEKKEYVRRIEKGNK